MLVKAVTTVDVLSGGRAWLGIGAGYHAAEAEAMGLFLPPTAERFQRLEETLEIAQRMWAGDATPYEGRHYALGGPVNSRRRRPGRTRRCSSAAWGRSSTLRLVARYGDACNLFDIPDDGATIRRKLDVLRRHCDDAGRPYDDIDKTVSTRYTPGESPAPRLDAWRRWASSTRCSSPAGPGPPTASPPSAPDPGG